MRQIGSVVLREGAQDSILFVTNLVDNVQLAGQTRCCHPQPRLQRSIQLDYGRVRDPESPSPQNRAGGFPAHGSSLFGLQAKIKVKRIIFNAHTRLLERIPFKNYKILLPGQSTLAPG